MTKKVVVLVALVLSAACRVADDDPPDIQVDRTACSRCGMFVSELTHAAAYRAPGATPRVFDDIGCLLAAAREEPGPDALRFWFRDAASEDASAWIGGDEAVFVSAASFRTPMAGGILAYRTHDAARQAAGHHGGRVIASLRELRSHNPGDGHAPADAH